MSFRYLTRLDLPAGLLALALLLPACTWFGRRSTNDPTEAERGAPAGDASELDAPSTASDGSSGQDAPSKTSPGAQTPTDERAMEPSESARENEAVVDAPVPPAQNGAPNSDRELGSDARAPADARPRPAVVTLPTSVAALAEPGADLRALEGAARTLDVETLEALGDRLVERTDELSQELDRLRTELASLRPAEIASQRGQAVLHSMERTSEQLDRLREKLDVVARALRARGKSAPPELERTVDEG